MKHKVRFLYPAIFIRDENEAYQVLFPDLNIFTDGENMSDAFMRAKDLLTVYFSYTMKYETEFNAPSKLEKLMTKCKENETVMFVDALVEVDDE